MPLSDYYPDQEGEGGSSRTKALRLYPDTNVLMHGRALHQLPWEELGRDPIELVICHQVVSEIDKRKRAPGRPGKAARDWSRRIGDLMQPPGLEEIRASAPRVTLVLEFGLPNAPQARPQIDLADGDQRIINQIALARDRGDDAQLLTNDNIAIFTAKSFRVPAVRLPDTWLKDPESDEAEKELRKREAEIARLRSAEPAFQLHFADLQGQRIDRLEATLKRYQPVPADEIEQMVDEVRALAPMLALKPTDPDFQLTSLPGVFDVDRLHQELGIVPVTQEDIDKYEEAYSRWIGGIQGKLANFHLEWNARRSWPRAKLVGTNDGTRAADAALVEVEAKGPFQLSGIPDDKEVGPKGSRGSTWLQLDPPPLPPKIRSRAQDILERLNAPFGAPLQTPFTDIGPLLPKPRDEDKFYWKTGRREPAQTIALTCQRWRHQREAESFGFVLHGNDAADARGLLMGQASATNLTDAVEVSLPVRIRFEDVPATELARQLVDDFRKRLKS